jgi:hypothetical protein
VCIIYVVKHNCYTCWCFTLSWLHVSAPYWAIIRLFWSVFDGIYETHVLISNTQRTVVFTNVEDHGVVKNQVTQCKMDETLKRIQRLGGIHCAALRLIKVGILD